VQRTRPEVASTSTHLGISPLRILVRGATRRCPVCGRGGLFSRYFSLAKACPGCGLRFEREPGTFIGAIGMNTIVTFVSTFAVIVVGSLATLPDIPAVPLAVAATLWAVGVAVLGLPFTKTLWLGIDLLMSPLRDDEAPGAPRVVPENAARRRRGLRPRRPELN
jgi:uncharacterized protein (DUF983 family)